MENENTNPSKGELLIADPFMDDPYFRRSVILIAENDHSSGTIGFIMNKPLNLQLCDLVKDFPDFSVDVYYGGPVSTESLYFVHSFTPDVMSGSVQITENLFWGGSFDQLKVLIEAGKVKVNGKEANPLYKYLKKTLRAGFFINRIKWNFEKFLIDSEGNPVKRYAPTTKPKKLEEDIVNELNK